MTGIKRSIYSNKTVKHSIKTVSSSIIHTKLIQPSYTTAEKARAVASWAATLQSLHEAILY